MLLHATSVALKRCEGQLLQGMGFRSKEGSTNLFIQTFGHFLEGDALDRLGPFFGEARVHWRSDVVVCG